jgi:hypothetical protein
VITPLVERDFTCKFCGKLIKWYPDYTYKRYHEQGRCVWPYGHETKEGICRFCGKVTETITIRPLWLKPGGTFCRDCFVSVTNEVIIAAKKGVDLFPDERGEEDGV